MYWLFLFFVSSFFTSKGHCNVLTKAWAKFDCSLEHFETGLNALFAPCTTFVPLTHLGFKGGKKHLLHLILFRSEFLSASLQE
jgi:hypothetical protein